MAATQSPKKFPRGQPKSYSTCLLYNSEEASQKLKGLTFAACNPKLEKNPTRDGAVEEVSEKKPVEEPLSIKVSDKMLCSLCDVVFVSRSDQKRHYKSDWHRYNIKQRLKGKTSVSEEAFDEISGNVSSISGSDSDSDLDSDPCRITTSADLKARPKPAGIPSHLATSGNTSTDSESESGPSEDLAQRLPKVYFRTAEGQLISLYRCVLCHKKWQPTKQTDLLSLAEELPEHMIWALFMAGGGHFAGAIFNKGNLVVHKTFHRYVVRAKRGTAQGSRDSQSGNAPKSAGATLRRYNEAALIQEIQDLITSWDEHIKLCDKIFLRAPSFNRKIFFGGKTPPLKKDDMRIRLIPFQTRRPTFNEVRRVYELLASVECYGDESEIQDFIPISPPKVFDAETGQLSIRDENQLSPRRRKLKNKLLSSSPLAGQGQGQQASGRDGSEAELQASDGPRSEVEIEMSKGRELEMNDSKRQGDPGQENLKLALPDHVTEAQNSTGTSTASESELVEQMETMNLIEHKEFYATKKPKKRKKQAKKRKNSLRCQKSPESNVFEEEKYHLKNNLYTACKTGDIQSLSNLLAIFSVQNQSQLEAVKSCDQTMESGDQTEKSCDQSQASCEQNHQASCNQSQALCYQSQASCDQSQGSCDQSQELCETGSSVINEAQKYNPDASDLTNDIDRLSNEIPDSTAKTLESENDKSIGKETFVSDVAVASDIGKGNVNNNSSSQSGERTPKENTHIKDGFVSDASCNKKEDGEDTSKPVDEPFKENLISEDTARIFTDKETCMSNERTKDTTQTDHSILENKVDEFDTSKPDRDGKSAVNTSIGDDNTLNIEEEERNKFTEKAVVYDDDNHTADIGTTTDSSLPLNKPDKVQALGTLQDLSPVVTVGILSETFGDNETTLLHVASREGHKDILTVLMTAGADPAIRDKAGLTPYMVSKDKPTRNQFRKFMGQWPDKYDYERAQIPPPLSEEQENERKRKEMERKKAQKKAKQDRQKEKRAEDAAREAEEREKNRFLALSDREKRALAAERRMLDQASRDGASKPVLSRCWQCGDDMTGKVPFEYMEYKFCTSKCLQQHRKQKISK